MKKLLALAFVLFGCSTAEVNFAPPDLGAPDAGGDAVVPPTPTTTGTVEPPPPPKVDSGAGGGGAADTGATPDAGSTTDASTPDVIVITPEPTVDAAAAPDAIDSGSDAVDAATIDTATSDTRDAAAPDAVEAGDAGTPSDAVDSGLPPICPDTTAPKCQAANDTDAVIQSTFPQPCAPDGLQKCGGVYRGVVETLPMVCLMGRWRLAGYWSGVQWVPSYECSKGCGAAGKLCDP